MELKDAIQGRRSIRKYTDKPVSQDDIREIVEAGIMAPSATNTQPWYFVAVSNPAVLEELRAIAAEGAARFRPRLEQRFPDHPDVVTTTTSFVGTQGFAHFVLLAFLRKPDADVTDSPSVQSVAAAIQNMILTAYDKGIGSCWMTSLSDKETGAKLKERFAPDRGEFVAMVTFGYPEREAKMPKRKDGRVEFI